MQLFAYSQVESSKEKLIIWVGIRGQSNPLASKVLFTFNTQPLSPQSFIPFESLPHSNPLFYRAIFTFNWSSITIKNVRINVTYGEQTVSLASKKIPDALPELEAGSFNLLLASCYYQPNDKAGESSLSRQIKQIKPTPDLIYFAGDQVYLDLPSLESLPADMIGLTQILEEKYSRNWFTLPNQSGLAEILSLAPVLCIPDDHEYWNNFPYFQAQLNNTWSADGRDNWKAVAQDLYRLYQMNKEQEDGYFRMDIEPLRMLFLDGRSERDDNGNQMFTSKSQQAILKWTDDLLKAEKPAVGLLSTGQVLLIEKQDQFNRNVFDAEMPNYKDYAILQQSLTKLIEAGIPVIYLTGDVHWGRIIEGTKDNQILLYEIVSSPSRLQDFIVKDQKNAIMDRIKGLWGQSKPFPRHDDPPEKAPSIKLANLIFKVEWKQSGDHVAMLKFNRIPGGIALAVDYICTDEDAEKRNSFNRSNGWVKIRNLN